MTPDAAPEAITQARMAEMLALAPLQLAEPPKDRVFYARQHVPMKWTPYKPTSQEVKRGKKGRWQQRRAYGLGWENADDDPQVGAWIEDIINHPDRRLASQDAGEGLREAAVEAIIAAIEAEHAKPIAGPEHGAWDRGRRYGLKDAVRIVRPFLHSLPDLSFTPPSDAGFTTREGGEGVREALLLARPIVEADLCAAIEQVDGDWEGISRTALEAIDRALSPSPDASPDSGDRARAYQSADDCPLGPFHGSDSTHGGEGGVDLCDFCDFPADDRPSPSPAIVKEAGEVEVGEAAKRICIVLWGRDRMWESPIADQCIALARAALSASNAAQVSK